MKNGNFKDINKISLKDRLIQTTAIVSTLISLATTSELYAVGLLERDELGSNLTAISLQFEEDQKVILKGFISQKINNEVVKEDEEKSTLSTFSILATHAMTDEMKQDLKKIKFGKFLQKFGVIVEKPVAFTLGFGAFTASTVATIVTLVYPPSAPIAEPIALGFGVLSVVGPLGCKGAGKLLTFFGKKIERKYRQKISD